MSLLPNNSTKKDQLFAEILDNKSSIGFDDLKIDVMTCNISVLPHIALEKGANIDGMLEHEARLYLKTFTKKYIGTIGAVEDAMNACFNNAELIEWFQDDFLEAGEFNICVDVKNDLSLVYGKRLFSLSKRLINDSKNVRSKLNSFELKIKSEGDLYFQKALVQNVNLQNNYKYKEASDLEVELKRASVLDVKLSQDIEPYLVIGDFKTTNGLVTSVNLQNNYKYKEASDLEVELKKASVLDVNLKNEFNYKGESEVNLKIIGGVTWNI